MAERVLTAYLCMLSRPRKSPPTNSCFRLTRRLLAVGNATKAAAVLTGLCSLRSVGAADW